MGHVEVSRIGGGVGGIEGLADGGGVGGAVVSGDVITSSDVSSSGGSDISNKYTAIDIGLGHGEG